MHESTTQAEPADAERLLPLVYDELRRLAAARLAHEAPGQTLQPTALVHEAYFRLAKGDGAKLWNGRRHFFGAAARAIEQILVENAKRRKALKRGGGFAREELGDVPIAEPHEDVIALRDALAEFEKSHPEHAEFVRLRYYAGLTHQEAAEEMKISGSTATRRWDYAQAWLLARLKEPEESRESF